MGSKVDTLSSYRRSLLGGYAMGLRGDGQAWVSVPFIAAGGTVMRCRCAIAVALTALPRAVALWLGATQQQRSVLCAIGAPLIAWLRRRLTMASAWHLHVSPEASSGRRDLRIPRHRGCRTSARS